MKKIILDTNFLMIPAQFGVDIFSELDRICNFSYELVIVPEVLSELNNMIEDKKTSGKNKRAAKLALKLLKKFKVKTIKNRKIFKRADEAIIAIASLNSYVATQDVMLRNKLRHKSGLIILRKKQHLEFFT